MSPLLKLFYNPISPPSRAAFMVATALKLNFEVKEVNILSKDYFEELSKINPQHTVPTLLDNEFVIWDSHAIAAYLVNNYSTTDELYPRNVRLRGIVDQRLHFDTGVLYPTLHTAIFPILFRNKFGMTPSNVSSVKQAYSFLNKFLENDKWLCGNNVTIADICCLPTLSTLDFLYPVDETQYPNVIRFLHSAEDVPYMHECNTAGLDQLSKEIQERIIRFTNSKNIFT